MVAQCGSIGFRDIIKRVIDIVVASTAILTAAPVIAAVAATIRWNIGKPVLYRQVRPGRNGVFFKLIKFRTMTDERGSDGNLLPDAVRLTPLGHWLRHWSLDELPQLFNVLTGDMSLVGPRPLLVRYLDRYNARQALRLKVKPGITGLAQVNGRNTLDWTSRLELDVQYVEVRSTWLDIKILALTILRVITAEGVLAGAGAELEEFWGEAGPPTEGPRAFPVEADESNAIMAMAMLHKGDKGV